MFGRGIFGSGNICADRHAGRMGERIAGSHERIRIPVPINEEYAVRTLPLLQQRLAQPGSISFGCQMNL